MRYYVLQTYPNLVLPPVPVTMKVIILPANSSPEDAVRAVYHEASPDQTYTRCIKEGDTWIVQQSTFDKSSWLVILEKQPWVKIYWPSQNVGCLGLAVGQSLYMDFAWGSWSHLKRQPTIYMNTGKAKRWIGLLPYPHLYRREPRLWRRCRACHKKQRKEARLKRLCEDCINMQKIMSTDSDGGAAEAP